ncbi:hypothetical protein BABINDRAFT_159751 [Babjeviella inositovora NRRL Y-12698]|uniref:Uncharacterized protein n=1 Tax=Babjeviella inositovora NRRL Y-12698 TaxID=984486 RepID=A0A1E3QUW0_9ASCO|nr:uncharacterized protein BABINDRAFT_159751 [Babjeviella inositovora NRRL Y-12698]ODQ81466.1 hypothetical protein BABINDRAFT_159751 [Babjeviella inositovora NRRL Y-12698]
MCASANRIPPPFVRKALGLEIHTGPAPHSSNAAPYLYNWGKKKQLEISVVSMA